MRTSSSKKGTASICDPPVERIAKEKNTCAYVSSRRCSYSALLIVRNLPRLQCVPPLCASTRPPTAAHAATTSTHACRTSPHEHPRRSALQVPPGFGVYLFHAFYLPSYSTLFLWALLRPYPASIYAAPHAPTTPCCPTRNMSLVLHHSVSTFALPDTQAPMLTRNAHVCLTPSAHSCSVRLFVRQHTHTFPRNFELCTS